MRNCLQCGAKMIVKRGESYKAKEIGLPNITLVGVDINRCPKCGEEEVSIPNIEGLHRVISFALTKKQERLSGVEIRFLRKYLRWSGSDFARTFGVAKETVSRWENDKERISPPADRLLRFFVRQQAPMEKYDFDVCAQDFARITSTDSVADVFPLEVTNSAHNWTSNLAGAV